MLYVPVVSLTGAPLMPCHPARARELVRRGQALRRFQAGHFYLRLTERDAGVCQDVVVGIDPGSKKEGYCVKSEARTFLNIQADAVTHVKDAVADRREARRSRRYRKTPCRAPRLNRAHGGIAPSTKARWGAKLRVLDILRARYPLMEAVVEDVKARTRKGVENRRWNASFSPLEVGKHWFYDEVRARMSLRTVAGHETAAMRKALGLSKTSNKMAEVFEAHCVDAWVLAHHAVGGSPVPDNRRLVLMSPIRLHRRELHRRQPAQGGVRGPYGGTRSLGFTRGSLVAHRKYGVAYVGGTIKDRISLHERASGKRLCQNARPAECLFLTYNTWRTRLLPALKDGVSAAT